MADTGAEAVNRVLRESAYVAVGFGLLGFQKAQVRRRQLLKQLQANQGAAASPLAAAGQLIGEQLAVAAQQFAVLARTIDDRVQPVRADLSSRVDEFEERLPPGARSAVHTVRLAVQTQEQVLRGVVGLGH